MRQRAAKYIEVDTKSGVKVVSKVDQALSLLIPQIQANDDGVIRGQLEAILRSVKRGTHLDTRVAKLDGWGGRLAVHDLGGLGIVAWYHSCGRLGLEVVGRVDHDALLRRANRIAREAELHKTLLPRNSLGLSNLRPWRALPADAEACFNVTVVVNEEPSGEVMLYRWLSVDGERWLVTVAEESNVVGDHGSLNEIVARLNKRYYWGVEVLELTHRPWPG